MAVKEYINLRNELMELLKVADKEDYDAVFYFIGQIDFDQDDEETLRAVADIVLMKATKGKSNSYRDQMSFQDCIDVLYKNQNVDSEKARKHIVFRKDKEVEFAKMGFVYIPESEAFKSIVSSAMRRPTMAQLDEIQQNSDYSGHKSDLCTDVGRAFVKQAQGFGAHIWVLIVVFFILIIVACVNQ